MTSHKMETDNSLFAQVIINNHASVIDLPFTYSIPNGLNVSIGDVVIVPFGVKNKTYEAFVIALTKNPPRDVKVIKTIMGIAPIGRAFDDKMLSLINFCRQRYLCTYIDALGTVVPSGAISKYEEFICLVKDDGLTGRKKELCDFIKESGEKLSYRKIVSSFSWNCKTILSSLIKDGYLKRQYVKRVKVQDKYQNAVELNDNYSIDNASAILSRSKKQLRAYEIMQDAKLLSVGDLKLFAECDNSVINALIKKDLLIKTKVLIERNPINRYFQFNHEHELTDEQNTVVGDICKSIDEKKYDGFLLHGVTGSGKTEVFMHCILNVLKQGRCAIVLVPEISLTPQTVSRFTARFGEQVAVFHSNLSDGERYDQWKKMRDGSVSIVVGARSAVFAPFSDIGVIIVDEEHSDTYKSEMSPRYDAKEVAMYRAMQNNACVVYASATPSFTTYYSAETGKLKLEKMTKRYNENAMPSIEVVDMREELKSGNRSIFSKKLYNEIQSNIDKGEQIILFLNRRGFSTFVSCRECGYVVHCPNCNIALTYHKNDNTLQCHYCGHTINNYKVCPECGGKYIRYFGTGTEKIEHELKEKFPNASVIRMDIDTTGKKQSHEDILQKFEKDKIDILVGTQMVTKGLDFPNVTLVGVIAADNLLNFDDYRAGERTFNILEQVTGRAGRGDKTGRAVIQTYSPNHESIECVVSHDYYKYYKDEIDLRHVLYYPPFCEIALVGFSGESLTKVCECAKAYRENLEHDKFQILGPIASKISKIKNKYRWQIIIKAESFDSIKANLINAKKLCLENENFDNVTIIIDRNPINIM